MQPTSAIRRFGFGMPVRLLPPWPRRLAGLLVVASAAAPGFAAGADADLDVAARVGSTIVRRTAIAAACRADEHAADLSAPQRQRLEATILDRLIERALLQAHLDREGIMVSDAELAAARAQREAEAPATAAPPAGLESAADRNDLLRLEIGTAKLLEPKLTAKALAAALERHRRELDGTRLRVSHVLLRPDIGIGAEAIRAAVQRAEAIREEVLTGRLTFAEAARRHSAGPSRHAGGSLGWIARQGPCVETFTERAFALAKGEISKPFVTAFGVHLVTVLESEPGRLTTADLRPKIRALVMNRMVAEIVAQARATTVIEYAAGVPHFDPATRSEDGMPRRVIGSPEATPGGARRVASGP